MVVWASTVTEMPETTQAVSEIFSTTPTKLKGEPSGSSRTMDSASSAPSSRMVPCTRTRSPTWIWSPRAVVDGGRVADGDRPPGHGPRGVAPGLHLAGEGEALRLGAV